MVQHTQQNKHKHNWSPLHMSIKRSHKENDPARRR